MTRIARMNRRTEHRFDRSSFSSYLFRMPPAALALAAHLSGHSGRHWRKVPSMSMVLRTAPIELLRGGEQTDDLVRRQVWGLLAGLYPPAKQIERRADQRFPYPHLIYLNPVAADGVTPLAGSVVVVGKHLSEHGLGFYHQQPLPYRRMIASLANHDNRWLGFLIDITWCRFTQHGWYDSGGRFLQTAPSPVR